MASKDILDSLAEAVTNKPPFCTGTVPTTSSECILFYKKGLTASWLNLSDAAEHELEALAHACMPATFGRNNEDVLDESYRKAGKLDIDDFSTKLSIECIGLTNRICAQLLDCADDDKTIKAEMYKLNVYGKGSFFKSHKDTPRGDRMFGSLVVVFPTPHEGGALVLRHFGQEWTFDSATLTRRQDKPCIAYIAFYSDVDHEVTVVESGYRVTLTYNLFFESKAAASQVSPSVTPVAPDDYLLHDSLSTALDNPMFLPQGGYLGFGLSFQYPVESSMSEIQLSALEKSLKGSDGVIYRVCKQLSLKTSLNAVYDTDDEGKVLVDIYKMPDLDYEDDCIVETLFKCKGRVIHEFGQTKRNGYSDHGSDRTVSMAWVTPLTTYSNFGTDFVTYGNAPSADCIYADLCIAVKVGPIGNRATIQDGPDDDDEEDDDEEDDDEEEEEEEEEEE
ncbi:hypothetical protein H0H87_006520 [Tephrocybe sp. NHM501043]|nr:hypothetical protein H0H87_006520 [Tephrocybe sp. NHM501043]